MSEKVYDFTKSESLGRVGEEIVTAALNSREDWRVEERKTTRREQSWLGIDFAATFRRDRGTLEIKTDMTAYRTWNIAFETHHEFDNGDRKKGWLDASTAKWVAVLVAPAIFIERLSTGDGYCNQGGNLYIFDMQRTRRCFEDWRLSHLPRRARNRSWTTWFVPVPIKVVEQSDALVAKYSVAFGRDEESDALHATAKDFRTALP